MFLLHLTMDVVIIYRIFRLQSANNETTEDNRDKDVAAFLMENSGLFQNNNATLVQGFPL